MKFLKCFSHCAPTAPSTTRWSQDRVTLIRLTVLYGASGFPVGTTFLAVPPTARMQDCGELMMAVKCEIPNMPRLETVMVPPMNSCGRSFPSLARPAISRIFEEISARPLRSADVTMGVINPFPVSTATDTSQEWCSRMKVSILKVNSYG